jgi:hypothetical protein
MSHQSRLILPAFPPVSKEHDASSFLRYYRNGTWAQAVYKPAALLAAVVGHARFVDIIWQILRAERTAALKEALR